MRLPLLLLKQVSFPQHPDDLVADLAAAPDIAAAHVSDNYCRMENTAVGATVTVNRE